MDVTSPNISNAVPPHAPFASFSTTPGVVGGGSAGPSIVDEGCLTCVATFSFLLGAFGGYVLSVLLDSSRRRRDCDGKGGSTCVIEEEEEELDDEGNVVVVRRRRPGPPASSRTPPKKAHDVRPSTMTIVVRRFRSASYLATTASSDGPHPRPPSSLPSIDGDGIEVLASFGEGRGGAGPSASSSASSSSAGVGSDTIRTAARTVALDVVPRLLSSSRGGGGKIVSIVVSYRPNLLCEAVPRATTESRTESSIRDKDARRRSTRDEEEASYREFVSALKSVARGEDNDDATPRRRPIDVICYEDERERLEDGDPTLGLSCDADETDGCRVLYFGR